MNKGQKKSLEIRQRRTFSESFKREKVKQLVEKKVSPQMLCDLYGICRMTVYRWLYQYSPHHQQGTTQVVQMESEEHKTMAALQQLAAAERTVGQKQMYIDYLEQLLRLSSESLGIDIKKNFGSIHSSTSEDITNNTPGQ